MALHQEGHFGGGSDYNNKDPRGDRLAKIDPESSSDGCLSLRGILENIGPTCEEVRRNITQPKKGDIGSGYMDAMHLSAKSDLTEAFVEFVNKIRSTFGADHDYKLVQSIVIDAAGEQREDFPRFTKAVSYTHMTLPTICSV